MKVILGMEQLNILKIENWTNEQPIKQTKENLKDIIEEKFPMRKEVLDPTAQQFFIKIITE